MEIKIVALILGLVFAAYCDPPSDEFNLDGDYNMQNDDNYGDNYGDADDELEESRMSEVKLNITTRPEEFVRDIGETVVLPCVIEGGLSYVQVWRKQEAVLFQSGIKMAATPNMKLVDGSLEISNLHIQDAGVYECLAMESEQNSPLIHHTVTLRTPPQIKHLLARNNVTTLRSGETLVLTCKADGFPKPDISWHKGSVRLEVEGEQLEIPNVKHHDAGTYKCLADNKIGEPAFSYINIKVEFKPVINIEKIIVSSEHSSETALECLVHSEPRAQVVWLKDGVTVENSERIHLTSNEHRHNLILKTVHESDFGVYTCLATNSLGSSRKNISLVPTPAIYRFKKSQADGKLIFTWDVQSKSNLSGNELSYRKKGTSNWMPVNPEGQLEVVPVTGDIYEVKYTLNKGLDPGEYELYYRSQNNKGWSENHNLVTVEAKHGHHKSHKKGHKHGKERQVTPTTSQPIVPPEHQETEKQNDFVKDSPSTAPDTSSATSISSTMLLISLSFILFLQLRI